MQNRALFTWRPTLGLPLHSLPQRPPRPHRPADTTGDPAAHPGADGQHKSPALNRLSPYRKTANPGTAIIGLVPVFKRLSTYQWNWTVSHSWKKSPKVEDGRALPGHPNLPQPPGCHQSNERRWRTRGKPTIIRGGNRRSSRAWTIPISSASSTKGLTRDDMPYFVMDCIREASPQGYPQNRQPVGPPQTARHHAIGQDRLRPPQQHRPPRHQARQHPAGPRRQRPRGGLRHRPHYRGYRPVQVNEEGMTVGTPAYMAPEQHLGAAHTSSASDIYSLGVIMYLMLTRQAAQAGFPRPRPSTIPKCQPRWTKSHGLSGGRPHQTPTPTNWYPCYWWPSRAPTNRNRRSRQKLQGRQGQVPPAGRDPRNSGAASACMKTAKTAR